MILHSQPIVALAVVILCTGFAVYTRRRDLLGFLHPTTHQQGSSADRETVPTADNSWQSATLALQSDSFYSKDDETRLTNLIEHAASEGVTDAKLALADVSFFGTRNRGPDYAHALRQYKLIYEEHSHPGAAAMLGLYHAEGLGMDADPAMGLIYYSTAAKAGSFPALLTLAHWYSAGLHVAADCSVARQYYFEAAKQVEGELAARKRKYRSVVPPESLTDKKRREDAMALFPSKDLIEFYQYSADRGQIESQTILGQVYYHGGADWDPDFATAFRYFKSAADQGGAVALGYIGQMHLRGEGLPSPSPQLAYRYFKASAEGNSAMGLNGMAMCYWKGIEVMQDYEEAWEFFEKAIAKEHVESLYNAAMMLKEWDAATYADTIVSYLMRAVKHGHVASHYELAKSYGRQPGFCSLALYLLKTYVEKGDGSCVLDQAAGLYKTGHINQSISRYLFMASQGFEVAQSNLAFLINSYDPRRAVQWWSRSSMQGNYRSRVRVGDFFQTHYQPQAVGHAAAAAYYVSAALHKDPQGAFDAGLAYALGEGVPQDQGLSALFLEDCIRWEKKAAIPVYLAQKYLWVYLFLKRHGKVMLLVVPVWLVAFVAILGILTVHEHLSSIGLPVARDRLRQTDMDGEMNANTDGDMNANMDGDMNAGADDVQPNIDHNDSNNIDHNNSDNNSDNDSDNNSDNDNQVDLG